MQPSLTQFGLGFATVLFSLSMIRAARELSGALEAALRLGHEMELAHSIASHAALTDDTCVCP